MTIQQIINIAKISQYLVVCAIERGGLFGKGIPQQLPLLLYQVRKNVERQFLLDPNEENLIKVSNYLYALCGQYALFADNINQGGQIAPIAPPVAVSPYQFIVDATSFIATGEQTKNIIPFMGYNIIFVRNGITQSTVVDNSYYSWNKFIGSFYMNPAAQEGELLQIFAI